MSVEQNDININIEEKEAVENRPQLPRSDVKVLVVDDREDNLFSIETILERDGYDIVKAHSGRQALKILLKEHDFSLILMDVQMPDMNGFETATLIYEREKLKEIPIIFITAHNHGEELLFKGYKMGGVDYIYKPINPELLRFKVSVFVELYRKTRQLMQQEKKLKATNQSLEKEIEERRINETKIKLLNEQLLQNNAELKAINEELDRFAYVASHDLQEPLRKIQLFSDKIVQHLGEEEAVGFIADHLKKITKASGRMQLLINDLLKFSRHTQAREDFVEVNLARLVQDVISDLEPEIEKKKGVVRLDTLPYIWAIPSQIQQLFQNLISNSLKFSRPGREPVVEIYSEKCYETLVSGNKRLAYRIYIRDNGIGFDTKYADEIFVVFKRLHSYHEFEGSGIGLSICKKIVEKHRGTISATGKSNEGAVFIITLPQNQEPA
jgi:signal transduction histidine kinase